MSKYIFNLILYSFSIVQVFCIRACGKDNSLYTFNFPCNYLSIVVVATVALIVVFIFWMIGKLIFCAKKEEPQNPAMKNVFVI